MSSGVNKVQDVFYVIEDNFDTGNFEGFDEEELVDVYGKKLETRLQKYPSVVQFFNSFGVQKNEDVAAIMLRCFHRKLNDEDLDFFEEIEDLELMSGASS